MYHFYARPVLIFPIRNFLKIVTLVTICYSFLPLLPAYSQQSENLSSEVSDVRPPQLNDTAFGLWIHDEQPLWEDMWNETSQDEIIELMAETKSAKTLPSMNRLIYRLLISQSYPPKTLDGTLLSNLPYARAKIDWLLASGYSEEARRLIYFIPESYRYAWFGRELIDLNFSESNYSEACKIHERVSVKGKQILYEDKVKIFCFLLANQIEDAEFLFTLYLDRGNAGKDSIFDQMVTYALYRFLPEGGYIELELAKLEPLHLAMFSIVDAKATIRDEAVELDPLLLSMLLKAGNLSLEDRILMAERFLILRPDDEIQVRNLYALFALSLLATNEEMEIEKEGLSVSHKLALLYARLASNKFPNQKAADLQTALALGEKNGRWYVIVRILRDELLALPADKERAWFASDMIRALLALGELDTARSWYDVLDERNRDKRGLFPFLLSLDETHSHTEVPEEVGGRHINLSPEALWPYDIVNGENLSPESLRLFDALLGLYHWKVASKDPAIEYQFKRMKDLWLNRYKNTYRQTLEPKEPMWSLVSLFEQAARENKKGYTVLLANLLLSSQFSLSTATLIEVLTALEHIGLEKEASTIAREYILFSLMEKRWIHQ